MHPPISCRALNKKTAFNMWFTLPAQKPSFAAQDSKYQKVKQPPQENVWKLFQCASYSVVCQLA